ncbi:MAG TPA: helix-turn-helix domain-containing protein [Opitutaceae bacterium]|nr:helix-turn-helix domain-containing protein [Opitutaceae bacterium]
MAPYRCMLVSDTHMITDKLKELQALKDKAAALEASIAEERTRTLAGLPKQYGFDDVDSFVDAVLAASGRGAGRRRGRPPGSGGGKKTRRPRATITDETRTQVKKLVESGKTGAEIAKAVGISLPSVQNIKKALGLVNARK